MKKLLLLAGFLYALPLAAQTDLPEPTRRKWYLPDHIKLQFAGNIGFMSSGPGYISRNKTLETDFLFGFLPMKYGGDALITVTAKTTYSPWRIHLRDHAYIVPFSIGPYLSHTFGPQFDTKWPSYYPKGYYWWATAVRAGAYIGGKVGKDVKLNGQRRNLEFYYEVGSYDLLMISYVQNTHFLSLPEITSLSLGLKFGF
ncbi:hypothetical protein HWI92_06270 [Dyadobacter sandarakinus]|uniref:Outer membrane protein beta-barrel domain-containing protein n=2 Tax=Dyadobacter sandarakinus TaxID=2747268 RepID=A0ABX7ID60_9BACT|nr:hypothetical protein HWI92_06270 [Dyadobacter sandarakinus]